MSESKLQIKIGNIEFSGEGESEWLSSQLDKVLNKVPELLKISPLKQENGITTPLDSEQKDNGLPKSKPTNLVIFLKDKNATANQVRKFLATATFLQLNGKNRLSTADITKALKDANQTRLSNPSDTLNQNVKKGHCEKDGSNEFFVTSHGYEELGIND